MIEIKVSDTQYEAPYLLRRTAQMLNDIADWREQELSLNVKTPTWAGQAVGATLRPHVMDEVVEPEAPQAFAPLVTPEEVEQLTAPAPLVTGIEVDSAANVWDGRIHASSRAKIADGTWRMKRGIDKSLVAQVQSEIAQTAAAPRVPSPSLFAEPVIPPPPLPSTAGVVVPPPPTPSTVTAPSSPIGFQALVQAITAGYVAKTVNKAAVDGALAQLGIPSLPMLQQRPDLLQSMATLLGISV